MKSWTEQFARAVAEAGCPGRKIELSREGGVCYCSAILVIGEHPVSQTTAQGETFEEAVKALIREMAMREKERKTSPPPPATAKTYAPRFRSADDAEAWLKSMQAGERLWKLEIAPEIETPEGVVPNPEYAEARFEATTQPEEEAPPVSALADLPVAPKSKTRAEAEAWIRKQTGDRPRRRLTFHGRQPGV